jgi:site-specific DNA-methyltransferase (adenine-specific)
MPDIKALTIVEEARSLANQADSWVTFSNALSDPENGLIAKTFPKPRERQAFFNSPQYEEINQILLDLIKRLGLTKGPTSSKSGKFLVRVPKTVHQALEIEAELEGVSLNQLAASKLAASIRQVTGLSEIAEAFRQVHAGYSTDRVVVDPELNAKFLQRCRELALTQSDYQLNHHLFDIRKSTKVLLPKTTNPTRFDDYDSYEFASEIAFRYLQRKDGVSLDRVLCDPEIRRRFDDIARRLAPGQSVLKLRCAALNLRKSHRLRPPKAASSEMYDLVSAGPVTRINLKEVPSLPGMYVFYDSVRPVFAGETEKLRSRIERHLEMSSSRGLPDWLEIGTTELELKYLAAPSVGRQERLDWLMQFVNRERPVLNYQTAA